VVSFALQARYAPNVWVSVILAARGESGRLDSATQRFRAGYIDLRVMPNAHRLVVSADVERSFYAPRDTATIRIRVADTTGRRVRSELAVWAVDVGVVSMTQMRPPDLANQLTPFAASEVNSGRRCPRCLRKIRGSLPRFWTRKQ
jgi:uncharacterized protein YfaS (alpha-2-macroglobulin family)